MSATTVDADVLIARNPSTGEPIATIPRTPPEAVAALIARSRSAQADWSQTSFRERSAALDRWRHSIGRDADDWARAIAEEVGKPRGEALGEVVAALDAIRWTARHGPTALADERLGPGLQRLLLVPTARLRLRPFGVVGMIGTWNYPLLLNAPPIAQAVFAGNGVVWKPSELATGLGRKLEESLRNIGLLEGLVATVQGGGEIGAALVESGIDKGMFTGGIENGRRVLAELGRQGIPAIAELSGYDAAVVLPDAPLEPTADALAWAAFVGAGQTCVAAKRVYTIGDPLPLADALARRAKALRVGDPSRGLVDVGPMISESARDRFHASVRRPRRPGPGCWRAGDRSTVRDGSTRPRSSSPMTPSPRPSLPAASDPSSWCVASRRATKPWARRMRRLTGSPRASGAATSARPARGRTARSRHGLGQRCRRPFRPRLGPVRRREGERVRPDARPARTPRVRPAADDHRPRPRRVPAAPVPLQRPAGPPDRRMHPAHASPTLSRSPFSGRSAPA